MSLSEEQLLRIRHRYSKWIPESQPTLAWDVVKREDHPFRGSVCILIATEHAVYAVSMQPGNTAVDTMPYEQIAIATMSAPEMLAIEYSLDNGEQRLFRAAGANPGFRREFIALFGERAPLRQSIDHAQAGR